MSYENKILQMKKMLGKKPAAQQKVEEPAFHKPAKPSYTEQWQKAGLTVVENDFGIVFKRQVHYPFSYQHGHYQLRSFFDALKKWQGADFHHPYALDINEPVLFFDTETTGLKGVGTHIFLLGFLEMAEEGFELTQYILADPAHEAAFLFESKLWQKTATVITYNGKSFDWPQLETRWTLHQKTLPKLRSQRQIDLLHSSKRLWKNDMERLKLKAVEEEKLGFSRKGDIPGHLAPIIYLDAVKSGIPDALMKVLLHNEWDLLSLITLYSHSTHLLFEEDHEESAKTFTNIGKWYGDLKESTQSVRVLEKVTTQFDALEAGHAQYYLALQHKKSKRYSEAIDSFVASLHFVEARTKLHVLEQLAILYEHQIKDYEQALYYTHEGIRLIRNNEQWRAEQKQKWEISWEKRLHRLGNKK
ncbi:ribonuclease H-like domain-containing protein [Lysinibacillus irui]|uniref:Ribonuclease H-like domain-containing protein n=1 Tax=Lysinibacillus irui TaxID=2998077 RepID=A0ABU5NQ76_9BACI|nr:ribonuclease H-like domain-containing protein [Lysinibacillus irui]MEA0552250.1 ribonuclease H-like domain-containing protein [Lysinibacillus irui]MEA0978175.1 ribonuclease H-like domain-containing protein [Lysinibacillus irui]MEA1044329.1 ribonuclease H-like domain-containing protein [Lysinibacillus irui]